MNIRTREPQYAACFTEPEVKLGPMIGSTWLWNARRLGMVLARYKFVAKMLEGMGDVAEIGCADGFASRVVAQTVKRLTLYDFDQVFVDAARASVADCVTNVWCHDITERHLGRRRYDAIYALDILEHIKPEWEYRAMRNIRESLTREGVFIAGVPSLESQKYASEISKAGHVNCRTGDKLREDMREHFSNVFLFGMNDEVLHTGFSPMCHYLFVFCRGPLS